MFRQTPMEHEKERQGKMMRIFKSKTFEMFAFDYDKFK